MMRLLPLLWLLPGLLITAPAAEYRVVESGRVDGDIVYVNVVDGRVEYGRQQAYVAEPGDKIQAEDRNHWLLRGGKAVGAVVGPKRDRFTPFDKVLLSDFDADKAGQASQWRLAGLHPLKVWRKSKAEEAGRVGYFQFEAPRRHTYYLKFASLPATALQIQGPQGIVVDLADTAGLSEAIHVTQLGFRPDDPLKVGFLSCWMGTGGALQYPEGRSFSVTQSGREVLKGKLSLRLAQGAGEDAYKKNYSGAPVYEADFSGLKKAGTYQLCVEGIGCSRSFEIAPDAWTRAFKVSAKGFYHQRSGMALGPPFSRYQRPENFSAKNGMKLFHSNTGLFDTGNGPRSDIEKDNFGNLVKGGTERQLAPVSGGYHDAGDWDRRIQHLDVARSLFELYEELPDFVRSIDLQIPESSNSLPDLLDEALFGLDFYRRLQEADGGVRGGIESSEHPNYGETSWLETLTSYAYAPDAWSSYVYAGVAARAAWILATLEPRQSQLFAGSAKRAFAWAEARWKPGLPIEVRDARNLAALELYRLDGAAAWHKVFLETTVFGKPGLLPFEWQKHDQELAAWVYQRLQGRPRDAQVLVNARASLLDWADRFEKQSQKTGFGWTQFEYRPFGMGTMSAPDGVPLLRAHILTQDPKYLRALILASQSGAGANPANICYTTGLGHLSPKHPLHLDSHLTGQDPPPGLTLLGPIDPSAMGGDLFEKLFGRFSTPKWQSWPRAEAFYDVFWYPAMDEFTVQMPMARNAQVWGYLAGRP